MIGSLVGGGPLSPSFLPFSFFFSLFIVFHNLNCMWVASQFFFSMGA